MGIGAGRFTDGQVLIINDILGITPRKLKLAKRYLDYQTSTLHAIAQYKEQVEQPLFPAEENVRHMAVEELQQVIEWTQSNSLDLSQRSRWNRRRTLPILVNVNHKYWFC